MTKGLFYAVMVLFLGGFLVYPVGYITQHAFFSTDGFTLAFFFSVFRDAKLRTTILHSFEIALAVTLLTACLAIPLANAFVRFGYRGKSLLNGLLMLPLILPPFVGALGFRQFFARFGTVNLTFMDWGLIQTPIDWLDRFGFWGVIVLEALHLYPIMFLNLSSALANIDPTMEEAARSQGAGGWRLFRTITLPLMAPGFFAGGIIVFIWAFTDLGTPLMLNYREVMPVQIFEKVGEVGTNPQGFALVIVVLLVTGLAYLLGRKLSGRGDLAMMSRGGVGSRERPLHGWALGLLYALFAFVIGISVLPHIGIVLNSFAAKWFLTPLPEAYTTQFYSGIFEHKLTLPSIRNSIRYAAFSTLIDLFLGLWIAYMLVRRKIWGSRVIDTLATLPLAIPGIVLAFGYVSCFLGLDRIVQMIRPGMVLFDPKENPVLLLILAYSVRRLPYIVRSAYAGFQQISVSFEEASQSLGASALYTMRRVTIPLIGANLVAGAILTFVFAMLEVSDSIILAFREASFPITKAIYFMVVRADDGIYLACALGVWAMLLLGTSLMIASTLLGKKLGELFRTG